jgi:hypothetical protein
MSILISSRIPDWHQSRVRAAVQRLVVEPMQQADPGASITAQAYKLEPLTTEDAKRLAEAAYQVPQANEFWQAIEDGGYTFMATRPLDLEWMVNHWRDTRRFGTYTELIETSITKRLVERNDRHAAVDIELSPDELREMAEQLAAVCSFSEKPFIALDDCAGTSHAVTTAEALPNFTTTKCARLLQAALFHEGSFGQLQFHHRFVREYLAASWVSHRIRAGLPASHALRLFVTQPFGKPVLPDSRRAPLAWLSGMSAPIRELVIRSFPDLILSEGDPTRWAESELAEAIDKYVATGATYELFPHVDPSALRRAARAVPTHALIQKLQQCSKQEVLTRLISLALSAEIHETAAVLAHIYASAERGIENRRYALIALKTLATPEIRDRTQFPRMNFLRDRNAAPINRAERN